MLFEAYGEKAIKTSSVFQWRWRFKWGR
jgi:hypothetical protein